MSSTQDRYWAQRAQMDVARNEEILARWARGQSATAITEKMQLASRHVVLAVVKRARARGDERAMAGNRRAGRPGTKPQTRESRMRRDIAASIWHLVDLKRAGYSPTMTELRIGGGA